MKEGSNSVHDRLLAELLLGFMDDHGISYSATLDFCADSLQTTAGCPYDILRRRANKDTRAHHLQNANHALAGPLSCIAQAMVRDRPAGVDGLDTVAEDAAESGGAGWAGGGANGAVTQRARTRGRRAGRQVKKRAGHEPRLPRASATKSGCHQPPPAMVLHPTALLTHPTWVTPYLVVLTELGTGHLVRHTSSSGSHADAVGNGAGVYRFVMPTTLHGQMLLSLHCALVGLTPHLG